MTNLLGVKIVNFKRRIGSDLLTLRLCQLKDLRRLFSLFTLEIFPEGQESKSKPNSLFSFYRWMKNTFQVIYLVEIEENGGHRIVGFAGLYDMELGRKLRLSLAVFHPEDRRRGYGEKALTLLLNLLQNNKAAEVVYAEILKSNLPSLRLCRKLGFEVKKLHQHTFLLEKNEKNKLGYIAINLFSPLQMGDDHDKLLGNEIE